MLYIYKLLNIMMLSLLFMLFLGWDCFYYNSLTLAFINIFCFVFLFISMDKFNVACNEKKLLLFSVDMFMYLCFASFVKMLFLKMFAFIYINFMAVISCNIIIKI